MLSTRLKWSICRTQCWGQQCPTSLSCKENLWTDLFIVNKVMCLALSVLFVCLFYFVFNLGVCIRVIVLRCFIEGTCVISCYHVFPVWSWLWAFFSPELWVVWGCGHFLHLHFYHMSCAGGPGSEEPECLWFTMCWTRVCFRVNDCKTYRVPGSSPRIHFLRSQLGSELRLGLSHFKYPSEYFLKHCWNYAFS